MSSEILLEWMSLYPKEEISEQVINAACVNIAKSNKVNYDSVAKLRRRYLSSLLEFGHIDYACTKESKYVVIPSTVLEIKNSHQILCGARNKKTLSDSKLKFELIKENSGLETYWKKISTSNLPELEKVHILDINAILTKLPCLTPKLLGTPSDLPDLNKAKTFNPLGNRWNSISSIQTGVYRQRDNVPPTVLPWYWVDEKNQVAYPLNNSETVSIAMCLISINKGIVYLRFDEAKKVLEIILPKNVYLPLMLRRPLNWLNTKGGNCLNFQKYENINKSVAKQISRILNVPLN